MNVEEEILEGVVSGVASRKDVPEPELPPLYESIEPDALEKMFEHATTWGDNELEVQFSYAGYDIRIQEPKKISIEE